ncbi:tyrosine-type recombinase/integrase [Sulfitobacter sp.]|uniref:tyrosine-type recombinase/integrase n=1 Tax=Sulfitobacter sp. TaxID=1903071 RepID=UPI002629155A|nr:tyrosine-type recombinase/integrase [Sulfitobacter sp.]
METTPTTKTALTEKFIKSLAWKGQAENYRDKKLPGFFVTVNKSCKSFKVQADLWEGPPGRRRFVRTIRHTIGTNEAMSLDGARQAASEILNKIKRGQDPFPKPEVHGDKGPLVNGDPIFWTVEEMMKGYERVLEEKGCTDRSIANVKEARTRYLKCWKNKPAKEVLKSETRDLHKTISRKNGPVVANITFQCFRAAYNVAHQLSDDKLAFAYNPVTGVIFNKERSSQRVLMPEELATWWAEVSQIPNPLRQEMHLLNLLSGLRPGDVMRIEKDWLKSVELAIKFPELKSRREFHLPMSTQMASSVERALNISETLYPGSKWLFPTRSKKGEVICTQVVRESSLPSQTGHILRHTHRTMAQREKINSINAMLLLDHKVSGIDGVYIHQKALFDPLLEDQQTISDAFFRYMLP